MAAADDMTCFVPGAAAQITLDEPDGLVRPAVAQALTALGLRPAAGDGADGAGGRSRAGDLSFVGLGGLEAVASCRVRLRRRQPDAATPRSAAPGPAPPRSAAPGPAPHGSGPPGLTVAYTVADPLCAALHALHGCADMYLVLEHAATGPRFAHLPWPHPWALAGITAREADVLALLASRYTNAEIAARLIIAPATARAHCRSIFRKLEVHRRREIWRLAAPPLAPGTTLVAAPLAPHRREVCPTVSLTLPTNPP